MSVKYESSGVRNISANSTRDREGITKNRIKSIRDNIHVGEEIKVPKYSNTGSNYGMSVKTRLATVVSKYDSFVLVTNGKYKWSVCYTDLVYIGMFADTITVDEEEERHE